MRAIPVSDVYQLSEDAYLAVPEDTSLEEVINRFAHEPGIRAIFLVDKKSRFAGTIRRADLMKWLYFQLFGRAGGQKASTGEVLRIAFAKEARDLARGDWKYFGVKTGDTLQTALDRMIAYGDATIPVLDDEGRIVGDLRVTDILLKVIDVEKRDKET